MSDRAGDWLAQAEHDLAVAAQNAAAGAHDWACFAAQQGAECAVKALHQFVKQAAWGHSIRVLLEHLPATIGVSPDLIDSARILDDYYIPTRYANGHDAGAPKDNYGGRQSREALRCAREIVEFCRLQMAGP